MITPSPATEPAAEPVPTPAPKPRRTDALQDHIDALPVIARIDDLAPTPFVLRGDLGKGGGYAKTKLGKFTVHASTHLRAHGGTTFMLGTLVQAYPSSPR